MVNLLAIVACLTSVCVGDVIRTVYCKNQCTDYLGIPENSMPLCAAEHLKLLECGTVITCDWADAERDKVRSVANSSDILCCYRTVVKEKGDCAEPVQLNSDPTVEQQEAPLLNHCSFQFLPWIVCVILLAVIALQAGYIMKLSVSGPSHQKVTQSDDALPYPQAVVSQPLVNAQLLDTTSSDWPPAT